MRTKLTFLIKAVETFLKNTFLHFTCQNEFLLVGQAAENDYCIGLLEMWMLNLRYDPLICCYCPGSCWLIALAAAPDPDTAIPGVP